MADIKWQAEQSTFTGADRRGEKRLGKDTDPVSRHSTIAEARIPDELAEDAIAEANDINSRIDAFIRKYDLKAVDKIAGFMLQGEGPVRFPVNVYDND